MTESETVKVHIEFTTTIERLIPFLAELQKAAIQTKLPNPIRSAIEPPRVEPPATVQKIIGPMLPEQVIKRRVDELYEPKDSRPTKEAMDAADADTTPPKARAYNQGPKLKWKCMRCGVLELTRKEADGHSRRLPRHGHALELLP